MTYVAEQNKDVGLEAILIMLLYVGEDSLNEYALLYGKRFVFEGSALSVSVGVS